jgi:hypothetical protein
MRIVDANSINAVSFSPAGHVSPRPLGDQTHGELMYRPFQFKKRCQDFIGTHDETLSVAMSVNNPDRSAFKIQS